MRATPYIRDSYSQHPTLSVIQQSPHSQESPTLHPQQADSLQNSNAANMADQEHDDAVHQIDVQS